MSAAERSLAQRARALMERVLRAGASLADEYPLIFAPGAPGELLALEEQGEVRACCAVLVRELVSGPERLRAGLIGSVCTHPDHRGRGLASRLLERAELQLAEQGCTLALLWADEADFYHRRGWRDFGSEVLFELDAAACARLPAARDARLRAAAPDDFTALHRLYGLHRTRVDRTRAESCALLSGPGIATLVLERGRDIAAYACLGRGADLAGCVHEWGGPPDDVLALVREHHARRAAATPGASVWLMTPGDATTLHARLAELQVPGHLGILAQAKLLDLAAATDLVRRTTRGRVRAGVGAQRDEGLLRFDAHFGGPQGERSFPPEDLLDLLAPPRAERERIRTLELATGTTLEGLPLPLYVWGLDSI